MIKNKNKAFTLIELLIVIAITAIIILGVTNIDFRVTNERVKLEIFTNKIVSNMESVRNSDLIGKNQLIAGNLENPDSWEININKTGSGQFIFKNIKNSSDNILDSINEELELKKGYEIGEIICIDNNGFEYNNNNSSIKLENGNYSLEGTSCDTNSQGVNKIKFSIKLGGKEEWINFDIVNGLITKD